jgi:hypothetical protein
MDFYNSVNETERLTHCFSWMLSMNDPTDPIAGANGHALDLSSLQRLSQRTHFGGLLLLTL